MSLSLARQRGHAGWAATSSGNAGLSFAAYGARAQLPGFLCVVAGAPMEKLIPLTPYGIAGILAAQRLLAGQEGIFAEPASACALAALIHDAETGRVRPDDHPVLMLTGAGWKDLGRFSADAAAVAQVSVTHVGTSADRCARALAHR